MKMVWRSRGEDGVPTNYSEFASWSLNSDHGIEEVYDVWIIEVRVEVNTGSKLICTHHVFISTA